MKNTIIPICLFLVIISCSQNLSKESFYPTGELKERIIYNSKKDTLNYTIYNYYIEGSLASVAKYVNGYQEGKYITYNKNGTINTISTYLEGKLNGIVQVFNSDGKNLRESYYIDGKQVIYSEFYAANNGEYEKQVFNSVIDGIAYPIGQLVKSNNVVQSDMSFYATITCDDTLTAPSFTLILDVFVPYEDAIFEVSFGKPDKNLNLISIDTSFVSASNRMEFIDKELERGMNNIFCEVNVISKDTVTFYAYKEVFVKD